MNTITLDTNLAKKLDLGMRGDVTELPFPVVYIWTINGQINYKTQGGALYYGGWACKANDLQLISEQRESSIPVDWKLVTIAGRDGDEFEAYTTRNIIIAPIGKRESWLYDGKRSSVYIEGGRRHLQVLAYLAEAHGDAGNRQFSPWGAVVLTAKGYQARNLLDAFAYWHKITSQIRWKVAPGVPAWCFYMSLGTFGKERQAINVGKPGAQSPITPVTVYVPDHLTSDLISSLFVGEEIAQKMADLHDQAADWLNAWEAASTTVELEDEMGNDGLVEEEIPF
jgi:hypothetical protein